MATINEYEFANNSFKKNIVKNAELDKYTGEQKDEIYTIIGDDKQPDMFYPQVKLCRWTNEVNFSVRLKDVDHTKAIVETEKDKIRWKNSKVDIEFYDYEEGEGGYEYEVVLKERPSTNKIEFTIQSKSLRFYYQPPLTEEFKVGQKVGDIEIVKVTENDAYVKDEKGNLVSIAHRSENVVGSYAVYHETKCGYVDKDGKDYKVGKAFHIYRPKIIDANGKWTWGELNISNGILTIAVDQTWLDNAVYPVKVDPTFGQTSAGGSNQPVGDVISGSRFTGAAGTATSITAFLADGFIGYYRYALYKDSDNSLLAQTTEARDDTTGEVQLNFSSEVSIEAVDYYIVAWSNYQGGGGSLTKNSIIYTQNGYKNIADIKIGDKIFSYNLKTKKIEKDTVIDTFEFVKEKRDIYYIYTDKSVVEATGNHKFYVEGKWIQVNELKIGDVLTGENLEKSRIIKTEKKTENEKVFDLVVKNNHNFFVNGILVHNYEGKYIYYDSTGGTGGYQNEVYSDSGGQSFPNSWTPTAESGKLYSIYCTYTACGSTILDFERAGMRGVMRGIMRGTI